MNKLVLLAAFLLANRAAAQCPYFSTCPTGMPLYCDYSNNDTLYWKAAPHTWSPSLMLADLPEANADLSIVARDSCGGQNLSVEYTLFLDLDGNDTTETVVQSKAAPPSGKVLYNNIGSPGYTLGEMIEFDHRAGLPDSMKYRFGLEISRIADLVIANLKWTTGIENLKYSTPKFPLGKHRIVWRIAQGGAERFCEYSIELKDCAPPVVTCVAAITVDIHPLGAAILYASDFVQNVTDNITPADKMIFSLAKPWDQGTGFPTNSSGGPITSLWFDCLDIFSTKPVSLWIKDLSGNLDSCTTYVTTTDIGNGWCDFELCTLSATAKTLPWNDGVEGVRFQLMATSQFIPPFTRIEYSDADGYAPFHNLFPTINFTLTPMRNDNPLNGVTTYDLALISKHILGIEPLNSPYKMIAADANKSGSITTFDIVEIRKLILGIYDTLPNNKSWRFVDKSFTFPNLQNPFQTNFPDTLSVENWDCYENYNFVGIKVGDVNNTVVPNATSPIPVEGRAPSFLAFADGELRTGETLEIPLRATEQSDWLGLQFGLDFDPALVEIENIESSALPDFDKNNWAQPRPGLLALSWSAAHPASISPDAELLRLRIKARSGIRLSNVFKNEEEAPLRAEAYDRAGFAHPLQIVFSEKNTAETAQVFAPQPNPTTAGATLPIQLLQAENLRLEVRDLTGKLLWANDLTLEKGSHALEIPASAMPQAGVYVWRLQAGELVRAGKITKI